MIKYVKCLLNIQVRKLHIQTLLPFTLNERKSRMGCKQFQTTCLKIKNNTSQTSKGLISPVFKLYLLSVFSPKGIPRNLLPRILTVKPNSFQSEQY